MQVGKREDLFRGLPAQPAGIPGTKLKLSRQRALGLGFGWLRGWINFALAGLSRQRVRWAWDLGAARLD